MFPALVARATRRELRDLRGEDTSSPAEVLGVGGRADWNASRASRPAARPDR
ncbi:hypothetical protein [Streptomyces parvus]|uniref:hypothetical protein n=1 Tax=Streptomyces parvus TaxID=66428 RepID=UPI00370949B6